MNSQRRRLAADIARLRMAGIHTDCDGDLNRFYVSIKGPEDTPYSGKTLRLRVLIPPEYPFKSPSVAFVTRIWHPNVCPSSGAICLDVLNQTWTPLYGLANVFEQFVPQLLRYPNADDPLNPEAARQAKDDYKAFEAYARSYTGKGLASGAPSPSFFSPGLATSGDEGPHLSKTPERPGAGKDRGETCQAECGARDGPGAGPELSFSESLGDGEVGDVF